MAYANMKENMPYWTKIYANFQDRHRARFGLSPEFMDKGKSDNSCPEIFCPKVL